MTFAAREQRSIGPDRSGAVDLSVPILAVRDGGAWLSRASMGSIKGPITGKICAFCCVVARLVSCNFSELRYVAEMAWKRSSVRSRSGPPNISTT